MFSKLLLVVLSIILSTCFCQEVHISEDDSGFEIYKCIEVANCTENCNTQCDCNEAIGYYYNETSKVCDFNLKKLLLTLVERYNTQAQLQTESTKVFRGILISVIFVVSCAIVGILTSCVYCFRMNYTDTKLHSDIDALSEKLQRTGKQVDQQPRYKKRLLPKEESCNVVVGDAGVFVV